MILFGELYFFACAAILLIPAIILGVLEKPIKYYGFLLTVVFVGLALWEKPVDIIYMVSYLILEMCIRDRRSCCHCNRKDIYSTA